MYNKTLRSRNNDCVTQTNRYSVSSNQYVPLNVLKRNYKVEIKVLGPYFNQQELIYCHKYLRYRSYISRS